MKPRSFHLFSACLFLKRSLRLCTRFFFSDRPDRKPPFIACLVLDASDHAARSCGGVHLESHQLACDSFRLCGAASRKLGFAHAGGDGFCCVGAGMGRPRTDGYAGDGNSFYRGHHCNDIALACQSFDLGHDHLLHSVVFANRWSGYMALLGTLLDPFLRPFRRLLPPIKGFDLSPILFFLL